MKFRAVKGPFRDEYLVEAVEPLAGNDAALIAVFNSEYAANELARVLNSLENLSHVEVVDVQ